MPTGQRQLGVVLRPNMPSQRTRCGGRDDVIVLGIDVQHGAGDVLQVDAAAAELERAVDELVFLVEVLQPLLRRFARMMRSIWRDASVAYADRIDALRTAGLLDSAHVFAETAESSGMPSADCTAVVSVAVYVVATASCDEGVSVAVWLVSS